MTDPNSNYKHQTRVTQLHRWLKRAELEKNIKEQELIKLRMELLGIHFWKDHPEYKKRNP